MRKLPFPTKHKIAAASTITLLAFFIRRKKVVELHQESISGLKTLFANVAPITPIEEANAWNTFKMQNKLGLMRPLSETELQHLTEVERKLRQEEDSINKAIEECKLFREGWLSWSNLFVSQLLFDEIEQTNAARTHLVNLTEHMHAGRYAQLRKSLQAAQDCYAMTHKEFQGLLTHKTLPSMLPDEIQSRTFRLQTQLAVLQGMLARTENKFDQCDQYYEAALQTAKNTDYSTYIKGSQLALWGDMLWAGKPEHIKNGLEKIRSLLEDDSTYQAMFILFNKAEYGLGFANFSWVMLRLAELEDQHVVSTKRKYLKKAKALAEKAIPLLERDEKSVVNGLLFQGIACYELEDFEQALNAFESCLIKSPYHPSLLRRKAMTLETLNRPAREARLNALLTSYYRPQSWLEGDQKIWNERYVHTAPSSEAQCLEDFLFKKQYQEAYDYLCHLKLPASLKIYRDWIEAHFTIYIDNKTNKAYLQDKDASILLKECGLEQWPKLSELSFLSSIVYNASQSRLKLVLGKWEELDRYRDKDTGYCAVAFRHPGQKQIIIAHAGTDEELADLLTDAKLLLGVPGDKIKQFEQALKFTRHIKEKFHRDDALIIHTGHSLGGAIASYIASHPETIGQYLGVTFDNPSAYRSLTSIYGKVFNTNDSHYYQKLPVMNYLTYPSFINCVGGRHLGQVIKLTMQSPAHAKFKIAEVVQDDETQGYGSLLNDVYAWPKNLTECAFFKILDNVFSFNHTQPNAASLYCALPMHDIGQTKIPLILLEPDVQQVLRFFIEQRKDSPSIDMTSLSNQQKTLAKSLNQKIIRHLTIENEHLIVNGPFNRWELQAYFRQQARQVSPRLQTTSAFFNNKNNHTNTQATNVSTKR